ncbi:MAG: DUF4197 domain-containing protein [Sphingobacteriales bacterium]|jgi:hypothetical protein
MKKRLPLLILALMGATLSQAQLFPKKTDSSQSSVKTSINKLLGKSKSGTLSTEDIAAGLKEALSVGAQRGSDKLSAADGFFKNAALKILMPAEAKKVEETLRGIGMGKQVDQAILAMNRAAEDATKSAAPIFVNAVKSMTIDDAMGILKGGDNAATNYLKGKTTPQLTEAFRPVIEQSLQKVDATKYWNTIFSNYNRVAKDKINPDLPAYVTEKALAGIFMQLADEEKSIRQNPAARTTELLKKVFN